MKLKFYLLACALFFGAGVLQAQTPNEYVVISGKDVAADAEWSKVTEALKTKHNATVVSYKNSIDEVMPELKKIQPRYVAIVEKPENLGRDYIIHWNKISREVDDDIYGDFLWGVITGYDAAGAMKMVNNSTEPLLVKDAVSTITEMQSGKWFDHYAWVDDHFKGLWGEKLSKDSPVQVYMTKPEDVLRKFYTMYSGFDPDIVVTASHGSEKKLEMPFSLGFMHADDGKLYADFPIEGQQYMLESGKRKVYFAVGNCLIGNVNNTNQSMAIAWMNSGNAATMIGYVVTTWYGRNGWGGLKYWLTTPGRYSLAEAIFLNQQDMMYQLNEWNPKLVKDVDYPHGEGSKNPHGVTMERIKEAGVENPTIDQVGFVHDRDVLAYYGDPKWDVRLQEIPEENDFTVTSKIEGKKCIVTIETKPNFNIRLMKGDRFKQEHVKDLPFSYFFPQRLKNPRLAEGQEWKAAVNKDFLLIYNPPFEPGQTYTVELYID